MSETLTPSNQPTTSEIAADYYYGHKMRQVDIQNYIRRMDSKAQELGLQDFQEFRKKLDNAGGIDEGRPMKLAKKMGSLVSLRPYRIADKWHYAEHSNDNLYINTHIPPQGDSAVALDVLHLSDRVGQVIDEDMEATARAHRFVNNPAVASELHDTAVAEANVDFQARNIEERIITKS